MNERAHRRYATIDRAEVARENQPTIDLLSLALASMPLCAIRPPSSPTHEGIDSENLLCKSVKWASLFSIASCHGYGGINKYTVPIGTLASWGVERFYRGNAWAEWDANASGRINGRNQGGALNSRISALKLNSLLVDKATICWFGSRIARSRDCSLTSSIEIPKDSKKDCQDLRLLMRFHSKNSIMLF